MTRLSVGEVDTIPFLIWSFITCGNTYPALDSDEKGRQKRFNPEDNDLHSSFTYTVPLRNHPEPTCFCRILDVCGTQDGDWMGEGAGESASLSNSVYRTWGKFKLL